MPAISELFKVKNGNTTKRREVRSKLLMERLSGLILVFSSLTVNISHRLKMFPMLTSGITFLKICAFCTSAVTEFFRNQFLTIRLERPTFTSEFYMRWTTASKGGLIQ